MKKMLFLVPVAAIALASCSSDEAVSQAPALKAQELALRPTVEGATRSIITDANFTEFTVNAVATKGEFWPTQGSGESAAAPNQDLHAGALSALTNYKVTKQNGKWELLTPAGETTSKTWYWSSKDAEANFTAYNGNGTITIDPAVANQKDVVVAFNSGTASEFTNGVPLLFRHVLSQIVIKADNKDADQRQIKVGAVRIHNVGNSNELTLPTAKTTADAFSWNSYTPWAAEPASKIASFTYYQGAAPASGAKYSGGVTLGATAQDITFDGAVLQLPQSNAAADLTAGENITGTYIDVLVQVQNLEETATTDKQKAIYPTIDTEATTPETLANQGFAWVAVPVAIDWEPGKKYTYVLHFSKEGIGKTSPEQGGGADPGENDPEGGKEIVDNAVPLFFTVTIDEWNDADNSPEEKSL